MKLGSTPSVLLLSALCSVPGGRKAYAVAFTVRTTTNVGLASAAKNRYARTTPCHLAARSGDRRENDAESDDYLFWPAASFLAAFVSFPEAASALSPSAIHDDVAIDQAALVDGLSASSSLTTSLELSDVNLPIVLPLLAIAVAGGGFLSFLIRVDARKKDIERRIAAEEALRKEQERPIIEFDDIGGSWERLPMLGKTFAFFTAFFGLLALPLLIIVAPIIQEQVIPKLPKIELTVPKIEVPKLEIPKIALPGDLGATKADGGEAAPPAEEAVGQEAAPTADAPSGEEAKAPAAEAPAAAETKPEEESKSAEESKSS